jgi:hypothetical protein
MSTTPSIVELVTAQMSSIEIEILQVYEDVDLLAAGHIELEVSSPSHHNIFQMVVSQLLWGRLTLLESLHSSSVIDFVSYNKITI